MLAPLNPGRAKTDSSSVSPNHRLGDKIGPTNHSKGFNEIPTNHNTGFIDVTANDYFEQNPEQTNPSPGLDDVPTNGLLGINKRPTNHRAGYTNMEDNHNSFNELPRSGGGEPPTNPAFNEVPTISANNPGKANYFLTLCWLNSGAQLENFSEGGGTNVRLIYKVFLCVVKFLVSC